MENTSDIYIWIPGGQNNAETERKGGKDMWGGGRGGFDVWEDVNGGGAGAKLITDVEYMQFEFLRVFHKMIKYTF